MKAKLAFISADGSSYSMRLVCDVLGIAGSWFHDCRAGEQAMKADNFAETALIDLRVSSDRELGRCGLTVSALH